MTDEAPIDIGELYWVVRTALGNGGEVEASKVRELLDVNARRLQLLLRFLEERGLIEFYYDPKTWEPKVKATEKAKEFMEAYEKAIAYFNLAPPSPQELKQLRKQRINQ